MQPDDPRHGTDRGHAAHMRSGVPPCQACIRAHSKMNKLRKLYPERFRKVPSVGSRRRVQALQALGYGRDRVAREIGYADAGSIAYIMSAKSKTVTQDVDRRIREVYDRLSMQAPPTGAGAARARTWAQRFDYPPPLAWDNIDDPAELPRGYRYQAHRAKTEIDEAVVLRILAGEHVDCTTAERDEVMRRWRDAGKPERELCVRMGWQPGRYGKGRAA